MNYKLLSLIITLVIIAGGIVYGYGELNSRVNVLEGVSAETQEFKYQVIEIDTKLALIQEDLKEIKQDIKELR